MEKLELETKIADIIEADNGCTTSFEYEYVPTLIPDGTMGGHVVDKNEVRAITYNPKNNERFLLLKVQESSEIDALYKILEYVENHRTVYYSHTIVWRNLKEQLVRNNTSYFYAKNALEAMEKFYHGKNPNDYMVFEVKLNPIS